ASIVGAGGLRGTGPRLRRDDVRLVVFGAGTTPRPRARLRLGAHGDDRVGDPRRVFQTARVDRRGAVPDLRLAARHRLQGANPSGRATDLADLLPGSVRDHDRISWREGVGRPRARIQALTAARAAPSFAARSWSNGAPSRSAHCAKSARGP